ncbi:Transposon Ty3-G Gag-Pol polyprotein [Cucumis melo var. makuwa]|uniref:Transposon Ty3-G Gag-Pol polyprotein n=1 Tax=Cucumis melo var. makuwa TaxID=1194695 RepID=A0A5D3DFB4_CUCMM|nr:Transposon Ty3-G Gag-Pol polyprotein [Cucumis melo var. makuwa]TYK22080.1 Transposon Ty3-G Gag-Pol polyprotein [Cucumis melo var. makuwa]
MVFIKEVVRLHRYSRSIVSDRDRVFLSHFWKELLCLQGTQLKRSKAYHPQTDGQTEVINKCLELYLRCFCQEKQKTWSDKVVWAEYWYNTNYQSSIKSTPYAVVYGQPPPPIISYGQTGTTPNDSVEHQLQSRDEMLAALKRHLQHAQERMKKFANVHRRDVVFDIGDRVFLKLQHYRQQSVAKKRCEKLSPRYFGPYTVLGRVGEVAYLLDLPETAKIHPVFHVSQLKKAVGDKHQVYPDIAMINDQMELVMEPENVTQLRWNKAERDWEYLVQWKDQPSHEATWESYAKLRHQIPNFHLEDKVALLYGVGQWNLVKRDENPVERRLRNCAEIAPVTESEWYVSDFEWVTTETRGYRTDTVHRRGILVFRVGDSWVSLERSWMVLSPPAMQW